MNNTRRKRMKLRNPQMYNAFMSVRNDWDSADWQDNHPMIHQIIRSISEHMNHPNTEIHTKRGAELAPPCCLYYALIAA